MVRADRYGMIESVELRHPFLYTPLVEHSLNTRLSERLQGNGLGGYRLKSMLKSVAPRFGMSFKMIHQKKVGTPIINGNATVSKMLKRTRFRHCSELLSISPKVLNDVLFSSRDQDIGRVWFGFLSVELLGQFFVENLTLDQVEAALTV